ncbi:hypothetical protein AAMO2058_000217500 [Amorphochlora amoebiformis]
MVSILVLAIGAGLMAAVARVCWLLAMVGRASKRRSSGDKLRTIAVLGSGGHTSEMITLLSKVDRSRYSPLFYVVADTDTHSQTKVDRYEKASSNSTYTFVRIPRSREVHMPWTTTVYMTAKATFVCLFKVFQITPHLVICNGPGTCIPVIFAVWFWKFFGVMSPRIMFVESFCRVKSLSLSGKIAYRLSDSFLVQWPQLLRYSKAKYIGKLC